MALGPISRILMHMAPSSLAGGRYRERPCLARRRLDRCSCRGPAYRWGGRHVHAVPGHGDALDGDVAAGFLRFARSGAYGMKPVYSTRPRDSVPGYTGVLPNAMKAGRHSANLPPKPRCARELVPAYRENPVTPVAAAGRDTQEAAGCAHIDGGERLRVQQVGVVGGVGQHGEASEVAGGALVNDRVEGVGGAGAAPGTDAGAGGGMGTAASSLGILQAQISGGQGMHAGSQAAPSHGRRRVERPEEGEMATAEEEEASRLHLDRITDAEMYYLASMYFSFPESTGGSGHALASGHHAWAAIDPHPRGADAVPGPNAVGADHRAQRTGDNWAPQPSGHATTLTPPAKTEAAKPKPLAGGGAGGSGGTTAGGEGGRGGGGDGLRQELDTEGGLGGRAAMGAAASGAHTYCAEPRPRVPDGEGHLAGGRAPRCCRQVFRARANACDLSVARAGRAAEKRQNARGAPRVDLPSALSGDGAVARLRFHPPPPDQSAEEVCRERHIFPRSTRPGHKRALGARHGIQDEDETGRSAANRHRERTLGARHDIQDEDEMEMHRS
ncbi:LOW QUALITY PROTEIN: hypothetical protein SETIT_3G220400v2 [Setaria italica]|uniref:Transcription factor MYC/MYB N-terminal domain-containing protein n=1 Tax=Setaria italica TaxID=4555 RepID=A0A368QHI6_SETIT|nr:LOW QUALITY PROTEIN: hypothetical protein SETIT_3G220400v2 [Setaria italica]